MNMEDRVAGIATTTAYHAKKAHQRPTTKYQIRYLLVFVQNHKIFKIIGCLMYVNVLKYFSNTAIFKF